MGFGFARIPWYGDLKYRTAAKSEFGLSLCSLAATAAAAAVVAAAVAAAAAAAAPSCPSLL